ncbi:MAG TPA: O-antigen ligase family protein [Pyrinomonadaceae bacterium]|nr:O-antigen ligase family protein [Pyrinomonadaceae bacterium]
MTTSTSNASVAVSPQGHAATERDAPPPPDRRRAPLSVPTHTLWSRFIILVLCLALVLSTLAFGTVHTWSLAVFQLGAGIIVALWMVDAWRSRTLRLSRNPLQVPLVGLLLVGLLQLLPLAGAADLPPGATRAVSFDPYATRLVIIQLLSLLVYFAAALAFIDTPKRLRLVVRTLIIFGFLLALFALMQSFISPNSIYWIREPKQAQPFGPFINRHHFAAYMEMALALPLGLLFSGAVERDRMPLYGFAALLMAVALMMTNSRGGILSLVAEVLFLTTLALARKRGRNGGSERREAGAREDGGRESRARAALRSAMLGLAAVVVLFFSLLFFGGEESLSRLFGTVNAEDPTTGRAHFWAGTLDIIRDHPVLGTGLGAFAAVYTRYDTRGGQMRLEQAHNDYLQLLSDAGIVGGLLGLFFVFALFRMGLQRVASHDKFRRGVALGALTGCFAVLVHSFFDFTLHTIANALLFLVLAALATTGSNVEETPKRRRRRRAQRETAEPNGERETDTLQDGEAPHAEALSGDAASGAQGASATN